MNTEVIQVYDTKTNNPALKKAARLIREGELVAFPTETVYGLGANALNPDAVKKIFVAKGRPGDNPLIVHIAKWEDVNPLVEEVPEKARLLMDAFWPGPLTIILKKSSEIPDEVTAGLGTVGLRMPAHPVARALVTASGRPIAAPSANLSGKPSPTTAHHVLKDMNGRIPLILDGGKAAVGLESTVLDMTEEVPVLLRPGGVTLEMLEKILHRVVVDPAVLKPLRSGQQVRSPGMKYTHYAPKAPVIIYRGDSDKQAQGILKAVLDYVSIGKQVGVLATRENKKCYEGRGAVVLEVGSRLKPDVIGANLFSALRKFDDMDVDIILAEGIEEKEEGLAVMNRMVRAAGFHLIDV